MIEPSFRTLPPPTLDRGNTRVHHDPRHSLHFEDSYQQREPTGDCLAVLPSLSRSAFNSYNGVGLSKCQCTGFFLSPGDPYSCLCGHPASSHSPDPSSSNSSDMSTPPSPSIPPLAPINRNRFLEDGERILGRISKLEQMLAHEIHIRNVIQTNHRILQINHQKLSDHCRLLEEEISVMAGKVDGLEVLRAKTDKLAAATELLDELDGRVEDLEFRSDDLEQWVDEEEKHRNPSRPDKRSKPESNGYSGASTASLTPMLGLPSGSDTPPSPPSPITPPNLRLTTLPAPSQSPPSKRRRSNSDPAQSTNNSPQPSISKRTRTFPNS